MANRYPLIANSQTKRIEELASGDNLNLTGNSVVGATTITSQKFVGNLEGIADFANTLISANNILSGTISSQRLSGYYPITAETANTAEASGLFGGPVPQNVLSGSYNIDITGTAQTANFLQNAANINTGIINASRLTGVYNIDITGISALTNDIVPGTYDINISGTAQTSVNVIGGTASVTGLTVSGLSTLQILNANEISSSGGLSVSGIGTIQKLNVQDLVASGVVTSSLFVGNVNGTATTSINVIGGIGSITQLSVSGISSFNSGVFSGSTSNDLVRITQTGSGNAFRVEDSSSPDLTSFIINSDGKVGIKTNQPNYDLDVKGTVLLRGPLFVEGGVLFPRVGILSGTDRSIITGINTSGIDIADYIDDISGSLINEGTVVSGIGLSFISITPNHNRFGSPVTVQLDIRREYHSGNDGDVLVSRGKNIPPNWTSAPQTNVVNISTTTTYYPTFVDGVGNKTLSIGTSEFVFIPEPGNLGIGSTVPKERLDVGGSVAVAETVKAKTVDALTFFGDGVNLSGIVTQITGGIGVNIQSTQSPGKGIVNINSYFPIGKTIFVTQNGNDVNSGLTENDAKKTIKAAAAIAFPGDTIKVFPGVYVENNPIVLRKRVAVEGTELRNCMITPKNVDRDLFYVNNGVHITDLSFIGPTMTNGASIVALQPLTGVSTDRFFDASRMIRYNLDFIANEAVGYLTSTDYKSPAFVIPTGNPNDCVDDIKDIMKAVMHDITRGGNSKCVGAGKSYYDSSGGLLHIVGVDTNGYSIKTATIDTLQYAAGIARSCVNNILWTGNYQNKFTQVRDLAIQNDPITGSNEDLNSCSNVISAIYSCVGVVTTIINTGLSVLGSGINTTFPGNRGSGFSSLIGITSAVYDNTTGKTTILAPTLSVKSGDEVELRDLIFECTSGGNIGTQRYPSGAYGYIFDVTSVNANGSFIVNTGVSTLSHTYVGGGFVVNRAIAITTASYSHTTGITTVVAPGSILRVGDFVKLQGLEFSCSSGSGTTTIYPTGNLGYEFKVLSVIGSGTTFTVNTGVSTIAHTYVTGGVVIPPYSPGVGPITQGPYVRNCTNFVPGSIGMKVDGFDAEPGDQDDIGVTGTMSVDSYTQYNQGGIGVSITNGAYSQLVSIFTICDDIAIFTGSGGQCDITNSNSSFGTKGLVSDGVGDYQTKSLYRYTGVANTNASAEQSVIEISGVGNLRPYDGQTLHFGELYYQVESITVTNGGSGYTQAPIVIIDNPTGSNGIRAEASSTIDSSGKVISVDIISTGSQYRLVNNPQVTIAAPSGAGTTATATINFYPIYYTIQSATLPSAGISTITLNNNLNSTVSAGTTAYFNRLSLQIVSSHSFEWVGSGNNINTAKPALGGVVIQENEVVKLNGGEVVYTSTDQAGNFRIGDDVVINQLTGTISGRAFSQSLLNTVTPLIIALGN